MNDYERVARVIRHLDRHYVDQPDLAALADVAELSQFHFHRLFHAWAGVTPKDFLQCLTIAHAKELLRRGESVLSAGLESGLSSAGRLHDLCLNLEAASPGELKNGGQGWTIAFGVGDSPFGRCVVAQSPRGICHLSFLEPDGDDSAVAMLMEEWPAANLKRDDYAAAEVLSTMFERSGVASSCTRLSTFVRGTAFQVRVWRALLRVPPGSLVTYGGLAEAIGSPTAARAVGSAVAKNPIAYLIPCHRVIRETGIMGEYRWGKMRKRAIVAWESAKCASWVR